MISRTKYQSDDLEKGVDITGKEVSTGKYFLLCQSCFWCASYYHNNNASVNMHLVISDTIAKCQACHNEDSINSMSISANGRCSGNGHCKTSRTSKTASNNR
jgi:hypothetical protein